MQREIAAKNDCIMDGRDIGTVVLPNADLKIFLTAAAEDRALRRMLELAERGTPQPFETVLAEIVERDERDKNRPIAPLRRAEDAVLLDTTGNTLEQSIAQLLEIVGRCVG
jgi:cytidylate kinase